MLSACVAAAARLGRRASDWAQTAGRAGSAAHVIAALVGFTTLAQQTRAAESAGDPARGSTLFRACAPCHSVDPKRNMTGPSLAGVWGRKAGALDGFRRYSPALIASGVIWDERALDPWLADPARFLPGNRMTVPGIKDPQARSDLIAYVRTLPASGQPHRNAGGGAGVDHMGGMNMGTQSVPHLKKLKPSDRVQAITCCQDTYRVTTADGKTQEFWERNLRFKTDSGDEGPVKGGPAILGAGMMGDRASVIFAAPDEISSFIRPQC